MHTVWTLAILGLVSLVTGKELGRRQSESGPSSSTSPSTTPDANASGLTGGRTCSSLMCVSAVVNGSTIQYTLQSSTSREAGWMAMGFGSTMANTPMVIMWANDDGSLTLSQRHASSERTPTVDENPPRIATADIASSDLTAAQPQYAFTVPNDGTNAQSIIWAFGTTNPRSSAGNADITQHLDSGALRLDLSQPLDDNGRPETTASGEIESPLQPFQKLVIVHAVLCSVGFLIALPAGALLARWTRTFYPTWWFQKHWIIQFAVAGPIIVIGWSLGIASVSEAGAVHFDDTHKKLGVIIFVFYLLQCFLGVFIHMVKSKNRTKRPLQNYLHGFLGVATIILAFYQVYSGYHEEWPSQTGRRPVSNGVNIAWIVWAAVRRTLGYA